LSDSIPGDTDTAAIKWATGKAQREARLTGRNGEINVPVARPGTNGVNEFYIVVYNTYTREASMRRPT